MKRCKIYYHTAKRNISTILVTTHVTNEATTCNAVQYETIEFENHLVSTNEKFLKPR